MNPELSAILDFETLSTDPDAIVIEIGCLAVNRRTFKPVAELDLRPLILPQLADGRSFTKDTIAWHEQKHTLPKSMGDIAIKAAVRKLAAFIEDHNPVRIWAWGKDFERPLFENLCRRYGVEIPSHQFRKFACARDKWQDAFGMDAPAPERTHHALQDCHDELRDLRKALIHMNLKHVF